eukprot:scpid88942/ scgid6232/ 
MHLNHLTQATIKFPSQASRAPLRVKYSRQLPRRNTRMAHLTVIAASSYRKNASTTEKPSAAIPVSLYCTVHSELSAASDSDDGAGATGQGSADQERALIAADIRDLKSYGCSCKGKNYYESLSPKLLEELMFRTKQLHKFSAKQLKKKAKKFSSWAY